MNFQEHLAVTQERLAVEADSLADLLEGLRGHIAAALIGNSEWERLLDCARELPATIVAFPFGFELPLHDSRPAADFGISVVGGTGPASFFKQRARSQSAAHASTSGIAWLLSETDSENSPLRQVVGRKMMLEYDIASAPGSSLPDPGIFLRPAERPIVGDGADGRIRDIGIVLDATAFAAGWVPDPDEKRQAERVYRAQNRDTRIESVGAFPSRGRAVRLAVTGFRTSRDVTAFLDRAGWDGSPSAVAAAISPFEERAGFVELGVHLDVHGDSLGSKLGLSFLAKERRASDPRYWLDSPDLWTAFMEGLRETGLAVPAKLEALAGWSRGLTTLFGNSGAFVLLRGIHHFKLVLENDRAEQAKGYAFMVLIAAPQS